MMSARRALGHVAESAEVELELLKKRGIGEIRALLRQA